MSQGVNSVLLVDDHRLIRDGIKAMLRSVTDFRVVGEADNGVDGVRMARALRPNIAVIDISLPGLNGLEASAEILRHCPDTRVMILSVHDDEQSVINAIRSGARAYVLKRASEMDLIDALRAVAQGGSYLSPPLPDKLLARIQRGSKDPRPVASPVQGLSPREVQVMRLVAEGKTSKDIAVVLELGLQTVRSYRKTMMRKLGVNNVAGWTQLALAEGLTTLPGTAGPPATAGPAATAGTRT